MGIFNNNNTKSRFFITAVLLFALCFMGIIKVQSQQVSNFYLENINGDIVGFEDVKGETLTIIDFWATWCKPCTKAMPYLNSIYKKYKDKGVRVVGISCDGPRSIGKIVPLVKSMDIQYEILKDIDCEVMNDLQYQVYPTLIIVDKDGNLQWVHEGYKPGDAKLIENAIQEQLQ